MEEEKGSEDQINPYSFKVTGIPSSFHSFQTGRPFQKCLVCQTDLSTSSLPYFIEKAFRKYPGYKAFDITYEFAMCFNCAEDMRKELSVESQERMKDYMQSRIDFESRRKSVLSYNPSLNIEPWIDHCLITGESLKDQNEYVLYGYFQGNSMMVSDFPYAIGPKAMDEMTDLLSNKTLGEMDDFMGRHFTGPPEVNELFKPRRPVLL